MWRSLLIWSLCKPAQVGTQIARLRAKRKATKSHIVIRVIRETTKFRSLEVCETQLHSITSRVLPGYLLTRWAVRRLYGRASRRSQILHVLWNSPWHKYHVAWWLTYPSEKWWSSSVGMMTFPIYGKMKKCSKPPNQHVLLPISKYP